MKRNNKNFTLVISVLLLVTVMLVGFDSCKKKKDPEPTPTPAEPWDPVNGQVPESVIPGNA